MQKNLTIAIQSSGRLREPSLAYLRTLGLLISDARSRALVISCQNARVNIVYVRHRDIPLYVRAGQADIGIVGANIVAESNLQELVFSQLDFGNCKLILAVPEETPIENPKDLNGLRIATSYPESLKQFLTTNNINAEIIELRGSVEVAPHLGLADAICDITQTGTTLKENKLKIIGQVYESNAVVIINQKIKDDFPCLSIAQLFGYYENPILQPAV